ncbi:MAG: amino acid transporter [Gammaproteobacteria bacterium]|nr:amino acid transporter [Gammaproteobacteria bacterium]
MNAFLAGLSLGFSLILAIGSQNAFVLRQGLKKEFVFIVCLICSVSDALLILIGVSSFSIIITKAPWVEPVARYGGAIFLTIYGLKSFWSAYTVTDGLLPCQQESSSLTIIASTCLAFTWLNPHVYLDTVVLLGSVSTQYAGQTTTFALGATAASFIFFFSLGYGASVLTPFFEKPKAWKLLDILIGVIMWGIAFSLVKDQLFQQ